MGSGYINKIKREVHKILKLLKLPVCPHCQAVYRYDEVKNMCRYRNIECRHCKKVFTVETRKGKILFFTADILLLVGLNLLLFHFAQLHPIGLLLVTLFLFGISLLLVPFTVRFRVYDKYSEKQLRQHNERKEEHHKAKS